MRAKDLNQDRERGREQGAAPVGARSLGERAIPEVADSEYDGDSPRLGPDPYQDDGGEA